MLPRSGYGRLIEELLRFGRKGLARIAEFAPTRLNLSWITDEMAVGGAVRSRDVPRLRHLGIRAIADCREEATDDEAALARNGIAYLRLPTPDATALAQSDLRTGAAWIGARISQGEKVYIHCTHGVGRAPLLAACYLVSQGASAQEALHLVKMRRWQASPNEEQVNALMTYAAERTPSSTS